MRVFTLDLNFIGLVALKSYVNFERRDMDLFLGERIAHES